QQQCEFYNQCGYQEQLRGDRPHVWIAAHNMLHHPQRAFGKVAGVVIDESFWSGGISGIESDARGLSLDDIALDGADYPWRKYLADILQEHPLGGLERARFVKKIQPEICKLFIGKEWEIVNSLKLTPQMTPAQLAAANKEQPRTSRARRMVGRWGARCVSYCASRRSRCQAGWCSTRTQKIKPSYGCAACAPSSSRGRY